MNAKEELINAANSPIKAAAIRLTPITKVETNQGILDLHKLEEVLKLTLEEEYAKEEYESFLEALNMEYYPEMHGKLTQISGYVWLEDGSWLARKFLCGEWHWVRHCMPPIADFTR